MANELCEKAPCSRLIELTEPARRQRVGRGSDQPGSETVPHQMEPGLSDDRPGENRAQRVGPDVTGPVLHRVIGQVVEQRTSLRPDRRNTVEQPRRSADPPAANAAVGCRRPPIPPMPPRPNPSGGSAWTPPIPPGPPTCGRPVIAAIMAFCRRCNRSSPERLNSSSAASAGSADAGRISDRSTSAYSLRHQATHPTDRPVRRPCSASPRHRPRRRRHPSRAGRRAGSGR